MKTNTPVKLGTQVYSLTNEFHGREYDFEGLIRKIAELDLGPGVEVVGHQSWRDYPRLEPGFVTWFRDLLDECELEPSSLGGMTDVCIYRDHEQSLDEIYEDQLIQLQNAAKLGFPMLRVQAFVTGPEVFERLLPHAEKLKVKMAIEIHAPHRVDDHQIMRFRETWDRLDTPYLGYVADFSTSTRNISPAYIQYMRGIGVPQDLIDIGVQAWIRGVDAKERADWLATLRKDGWKHAHVTAIGRMFGMFGKQPVKDWRQVMDKVIHVHAKFYDIDEAGEETAIAFRELLPLIRDSGYSGYISSEWEGHVFSDGSGFDMLVKQQKLSVDALNNN